AAVRRTEWSWSLRRRWAISCGVLLRLASAAAAASAALLARGAVRAAVPAPPSAPHQHAAATQAPAAALCFRLCLRDALSGTHARPAAGPVEQREVQASGVPERLFLPARG